MRRTGLIRLNAARKRVPVPRALWASVFLALFVLLAWGLPGFSQESGAQNEGAPSVLIIKAQKSKMAPGSGAAGRDKAEETDSSAPGAAAGEHATTPTAALKTIVAPAGMKYTPRPARNQTETSPSTRVAHERESTAPAGETPPRPAVLKSAEDSTETAASAPPRYTPRPERSQAVASAPIGQSTPATAIARDYDSLEYRNSRYFARGVENSRKVALTFDDGPNPEFTPKILRVLMDKNAPATFFLVGENVEKYPLQAIETAERGFEIGNHTWSHPDLKDAGENKIELQLRNTSDIIERVTGKRPTLYRPAYGIRGKNILKVCDSLGLEIIMWSIDTEDWKAGSTVDSVVQAVSDQLKGGAIILMHDRLSDSLEALPRVIDLVRERGFELATVSDLMREERDPLAATPAPAAISPETVPTGD